MAGGVSLLVATLIGVFITPDGIVVGSDRALSNRTGQVASQPKYCVTGPRSVATLQGAYYLQDVVTKATLELYDRFRDLCSRNDRSLVSMTLRQQAEYIAARLQADLVSFLEGLPAAEVVHMYSSSPVVARIAVTGYGERGAESVVVGLGIATERQTNRWEAQVRDLSRLIFADCGVRFHGQEVVVLALGRDTDARIPRAERQHADVAKLTSLVRGRCADASIRTAQAMFVQAVRLTVTLGERFGIPKGSVGPPIDVVVIPREGPISVTDIASLDP
jgi:hypothetical protein